MTRGALQELFGINRPILLGPFGGLSSVALTAAVSELGGLGSYGLYGYGADRIAETIASLRSATQRPFAVNLWLRTGDEAEPDAVDLAQPLDAVQGIFDDLRISVPPVPERFLPTVDEQFDAVLADAPAAISVVFGVPTRAQIDRVHAAGAAVIGTATTVEEASALDAGGVDCIVATGSEAAGHRVSFLRPADRSLVGAFALIPQVVDAVSVPVIAAGGIADRRGVAAAFALGASGVQVGTAFLATRESAATDGHRKAIRGSTAESTILTRAMSGRLARGIPNRATSTIEQAGPTAIAPFPAQNWLTGAFRSVAGMQGRSDLVSLWAGQSAGLSRHDDAASVFAELAAGLPD